MLSEPPLASARPLPAFQQGPKGRDWAAHTQRMREARADLRSVPERDYVQAIDRWLGGGPWEGAAWSFQGVRLAEDGDCLTLKGVAIVSRSPSRLLDLPVGARTSLRLEARALAAVAVRGDAGRYDGHGRKLRV